MNRTHRKKAKLQRRGTWRPDVRRHQRHRLSIRQAWRSGLRFYEHLCQDEDLAIESLKSFMAANEIPVIDLRQWP